MLPLDSMMCSVRCAFPIEEALRTLQKHTIYMCDCQYQLQKFVESMNYLFTEFAGGGTVLFDGTKCGFPIKQCEIRESTPAGDVCVVHKLFVHWLCCWR